MPLQFEYGNHGIRKGRDWLYPFFPFAAPVTDLRARVDRWADGFIIFMTDAGKFLRRSRVRYEFAVHEEAGSRFLSRVRRVPG